MKNIIDLSYYRLRDDDYYDDDDDDDDTQTIGVMHIKYVTCQITKAVF